MKTGGKTKSEEDKGFRRQQCLDAEAKRSLQSGWDGKAEDDKEKKIDPGKR